MLQTFPVRLVIIPHKVRLSSDLRDGSLDHYETWGHLKVPVWDDGRVFEILKNFKMATWR